MSTPRSLELGARLRSAREINGYSKRALAVVVDVNVSQIIRLERGAVESPGIELLTRIADALHLPLASLLDHAGYPMHHDVPNLLPYLLDRYPDLPAAAIAEMARYVTEVTRRYGVGRPELSDDNA